MSARKRITRGSGEEHLRGRGVLQSAEHGPDAIPVEFLIAFTKAIIRLVPSTDVLYLAAGQANRACPLTKEQRDRLNAGLKEQVNKSSWPKGFM